METLYNVHQHHFSGAAFLSGRQEFPGYSKIILPDTAPPLFLVLGEGNFLGKREQSLQLVTITKKTAETMRRKSKKEKQKRMVIACCDCD